MLRKKNLTPNSEKWVAQIALQSGSASGGSEARASSELMLKSLE